MKTLLDGFWYIENTKNMNFNLSSKIFDILLKLHINSALMLLT